LGAGCANNRNEFLFSHTISPCLRFTSHILIFTYSNQFICHTQD
jgi:hypothetical protein